jgi:GT2 family glycosyltransferase
MCISILITNYNTSKQLCESLICINKFDNPFISEIIVLDDSSNEKLPGNLQDYSKLKFYKNKINKGYVRCVNLGVSLCKNEIILLLDSDAYIDSEITDIYHLFNNKSQLALLGFNIIKSDSSKGGGFEQTPNLFSLLLGQFLYDLILKFPLFINRKKIVFHSFAISFRKSAFYDVGGFDEQFDFLDADIDFSNKINKHKFWKSIQVDNIQIIHDGGGSPQLTSKRVIRFYQNRIKFLKKNYYNSLVTLFCYLTIPRIVIELLFLFIKVLFLPTDIVKDKIFSRKKIIPILLNI